MSISTQIERLYNVRADIASAIQSKGIAVPETFKLADAASLINQIGGCYMTACSASSQICIIDRSGNIGNSMDDPFFSQVTIKNYAVVDKSADYSQSGLGNLQTTEIVYGTTVIAGKEYGTVSINGKTWITENLDLSDSGISESETDAPQNISIPASFYYKDDPDTYGKYGRLYNGYAMQYIDENKETIIPGWRIPTLNDWAELATFIEGTDAYSSNGTTGQCGMKMKSNDPNEWSRAKGLNLWNFSLLPAGERSLNATGTDAYKNGMDAINAAAITLWSSTKTSGSGAYSRFNTPWVNNQVHGLGLGNNYIYNAYSIRLVKDE